MGKTQEPPRMQTARIMLAIGGEEGQVIPKWGVTAAEVEVLRQIHGTDSVKEIVVDDGDGIERSNREELERLRFTYPRKDPREPSPVERLFPGAAARVFTSFDELDFGDLDRDEIFKTRKKAKADDKPAATPLKVKASPVQNTTGIEPTQENPHPSMQEGKAPTPQPGNLHDSNPPGGLGIFEDDGGEAETADDDVAENDGIGDIDDEHSAKAKRRGGKRK